MNRKLNKGYALAMAAVLGISVVPGGSYVMAAGDGAAAEENAAAENAYFHSENADEVNIQDTGVYTIILKANEGWSFTLADNVDVTPWLVDEEGSPVFTDTEGIAFTQNGEEGPAVEGNTLKINIDVSKISGFTSNGKGDIYVLPPSDSMWVAGENKGFYKATAEWAGCYTIPKVEVIGQIDGSKEKEFILEEDTVTLALDGEGLDDSLIDSSEAVIEIVDGDGYYVSDFVFTPGSIGGTWTNGENTYSMSAEDISFDNGGYDVVDGGRGWSQQGGDRNGNYNISIGLSGLKYNGLPLSDVKIPLHVYCYGRTFTVEGGSLIAESQPKWTSSAEDNIPVLCDVYPDELYAVWPLGFDASGLTSEDFTLTLCSEYGDELVLEAGKDYSAVSENGRSVITVNYMNWSFTPVYTTLRVDVNTDALVWDQEMYRADTISCTYDIASVYAYYTLSGGLSGTLSWTFYGLEGFDSWEQLYDAPTYRLAYVDEGGTKNYYAEDENGNGILVDSEQKAISYDASEDCSTAVINQVAYVTRREDMTEEKEADGQVITFSKEYDNVEYTLRTPDKAVGVTAKPGYALGSAWDTYLRWPWQTFINTGYQGGTK